MRSYRPHTDSETKTVTIEPGCRDTTIVHMSPSPGVLQGLGPDGPHPLCMAGRNHR